jgi:hypothetical protein
MENAGIDEEDVLAGLEQSRREIHRKLYGNKKGRGPKKR